MSEPTEGPTFTQRAGLRGWWFEIALFAVYVPVGAVWARNAPSFTWVVGIAAAAIATRLALFSGPHRRGVTVTATAVRYGRTRLPLADIRTVHVTDRATLRRKKNELDMEFVPPGPREAVILEMVSPEGIDAAIGISVDDAQGLADEILTRRATADRPPLPRPPSPLPYRGRQGLSRLPATLIMAPAVGFDLVALTRPDSVIGMTLVVGGLVLFMARRPVRVDDAGLRVGHRTLRWDEIVSVRCVTYGEIMQLPRRYQQAPVWGPPYALVMVRHPRPGEEDFPPRRRAYILAVADPIDVSATVPDPR